MAEQLDCYGLTDIGLRRTRNEDHFLIASLKKAMCIHQTSLDIDGNSRSFGRSLGHLFVVADGMGGEPEGQRASTVAIDGLTRYLLNPLPGSQDRQETSETDLEDELREAVEQCETDLNTLASATGHHRMGTTLTMAYVMWPQAFVVHVGDSRCYLVREGAINRLTRDHTIAALMAEREGIDEQHHSLSNYRHYLWNALGGETGKPTIDISKIELQQGDSLVLSTDGLHSVVPSKEILEILDENQSAEQCCHQLIDSAKEHNGGDNITTVVARFGVDAPHETEAAHASRPTDSTTTLDFGPIGSLPAEAPLTTAEGDEAAVPVNKQANSSHSTTVTEQINTSQQNF